MADRSAVRGLLALFLATAARALALQLVYRWTGSAWIPIDPGEVGMMVTTAVS